MLNTPQVLLQCLRLSDSRSAGGISNTAWARDLAFLTEHLAGPAMQVSESLQHAAEIVQIRYERLCAPGSGTNLTQPVLDSQLRS